jgi:carbamoyltransferase
MGFGPRSSGTRSILADPSGRFVRQNVNEYLRQAPLDEPLSVAFAPSASAGVLHGPSDGGWPIIDAVVRPQHRTTLAGVADARGQVRIHPVSPADAPALCDLLEAHAARTGVPGLVDVNLCGPGEPTACTPRDAIRTVYSSAIDALVMDRFVLMKDHWLLRADAD